jgi:Na+/melibiose symporter-like transporter
MNIFTLFIQLLAFGVEIAMLVAFVCAGLSIDNWLLKILVSIGSPTLVILIWSKWLAPRATQRLAMPWIAGAELCLFLLSAGALWLAGQHQWGLVMMGTSFASVALSLATKQFSQPKLH